MKIVYILKICVCLLLDFGNVYGLPEIIKIGGLFETGDEVLELAFRYAVDRVNADGRILPDSRLSAQVVRVEKHDSFQTARKVCDLLGEGMAAIFGPQSIEGSSAVQSTCGALEVPHIQTRWDIKAKVDNHSINLYPTASSLSKSIKEFIILKDWKLMAILYTDNDALLRLQLLLKAPELRKRRVVVRQFEPGADYRKLLKELRGVFKNFVIDLPPNEIPFFLQDAKELDMFTEYYNYVFTTLDIHTVNLEEYQHSGVNITGFRIVNVEAPEFEEIIMDWRSGPLGYGRRRDTEAQFSKNVTTEVALMYDSVKLVASALSDIGPSQHFRIRPVSCDTEQSWSSGHELVTYIRSKELIGLSGPIKFDNHGFRDNYKLQVVDLTSDGLKNVAIWNIDKGFNQTSNYTKSIKRSKETIRNKTLTITTILSSPYMILKENIPGEPPFEGNDRFEGYCIDLMEEIAQELEFNYTIKIVADRSYGKIINEQGDWNGMIGELLSGKAEIVLADLTITHVRESAVDFTMPFMNLGISIIFKKAQKQDPSLFSFLSPLSVEVWLYMVTGFLGISLCMFIMARFTPYEWENPHPCDPDPEELENQFDLQNTFWFTVGCLMQQGCDLMPRSISTRMLAGYWWFFTLIMVSSYTANLAAFLTAQRLGSPIESAEDLAKQTKIQYGCMESGSTQAFFKETQYPTYKRMWGFMESTRPSVFTDSNTKGVERVRKGNYAFLMESTSIEYLVERKCDLQQVGNLLDSKGYGIATPKGSPYTHLLSSTLIMLQEAGRLHILKEKWWKKKYIGIPCHDDDGGSEAAAELGMANVGGVFLVLFVGTALALVIVVFEFFWNSRKRPKDQRENFFLEIYRELKVVVCGGGSSRPAPKDEDEESKPSSRSASLNNHRKDQS